MNKLINGFIFLIVGGATHHSAAFQSPLSSSSSFRRRRCTDHKNVSVRPAPSPTPGTTGSFSLQLSPSDITDPSFLAGSFLWGLNFYYGFDWLLAPLGTGLDSDFNPAYRTATLVGSLLAGKSLEEALEASNGPITDEDGDRPEMGSRIGAGANVGYVAAAATEQGKEEDSDWLRDREAGLRSSAPFFLRFGVLLFYGLVGLLVMGVTESLQTAGVLAIPALVYEIGRPSLPTREEALLDAKLDKAVEAFVKERVLVYGRNDEDLPRGLAPVKRDEATNERELVAVFKRDLQQQQQQQQQQDGIGIDDLKELSDFQIEMRFRELGTGRSEGGYIKGLRLLKEPIPLVTKESTETKTVV